MAKDPGNPSGDNKAGPIRWIAAFAGLIFAIGYAIKALADLLN